LPDTTQLFEFEPDHARHGHRTPWRASDCAGTATAKGGTPVIDLDKPWNDVTDQLRPAWPELDEIELDGPDRDDTPAPGEVTEADPADVADQRRAVSLPDDEPDLGRDPAGVWT
jgi:hypothetical protein